jgi:hypothetical protein
MSAPYQPFGSNDSFSPPPSFSGGGQFPGGGQFSSGGNFSGGGQFPGHGPQYFPPGPPPTSVLAVLSLAGGIGSLLFSAFACCCALSPLTMLTSLVSAGLGHAALYQIHRSPGAIGGKELAWGGLLAAYPAFLFNGAITEFLVWAMVTADKQPARPPAFIPPGEAALSNEGKILSRDQGTAQGELAGSEGKPAP